MDWIDCQLLAIILTNFNDHQSTAFFMKLVGLIFCRTDKWNLWRLRCCSQDNFSITKMDAPISSLKGEVDMIDLWCNLGGEHGWFIRGENRLPVHRSIEYNESSEVVKWLGHARNQTNNRFLGILKGILYTT
jgi:hypothetical protein